MRVVCVVDPSFWDCRHPEAPLPIRGNAYEVVGETACTRCPCGKHFFFLAELGDEYAYCTLGFRPARNTDISVFHALLAPVRQSENA